MNKTLDYYEKNAKDFADSTADVDFSETQDLFINNLSVNCYIYDITDV